MSDANAENSGLDLDAPLASGATSSPDAAPLVDVLAASSAAPPPATPDVGSDRWRVRLATGEERLMTLDELDAAFNGDVVDANTRVQEPESTAWVRLGEILGLDDAEAPVNSLAPVAFEAPVTETPSDALDLELEPAAFRSKKKGLVIGLVAAGTLAAAAVVGVTSMAGSVDARAVAADVKATSAIGVQGAAAPASPTDLADVPSSKDKLTDEQKRKLLEADKARDTATKARVPSGAPARRSTSAPSTGKAPFVQGGDKYDPMNGSL